MELVKEGGKKSHLCVTLIHNKEEGNVEDIKKKQVLVQETETGSSASKKYESVIKAEKGGASSKQEMSLQLRFLLKYLW